MQIAHGAVRTARPSSYAEPISSVEASKSVQQKNDWLYLSFAIGCALFPLIARLYLLLIPVPLNIDEAQWTVSARQILDDPILWRANDLTTSGPLNAVVVAWPRLLGLLPSLLTSRLTGILLQSGTMLGLALLIPRNALFSGATAAVLTSAVLFGTSLDPNYNHYSSEILSIALIVGFCALFATSEPGGASPLRWIALGLLATSLPFAKLQSALFCGLFHACCLHRFGIEAHRGVFSVRAFAAYAFGAVLPVLVLVAPLFLVGEQNAFLIGYLGLGAHYGGSRSLSVISGAFLVLVPVAGVAFVFILARLSERWRWAGLRVDLLILSLGLWPVAFFTIWLPGRDFHHYLLYGFVALPLSCILAERILPARADHPARRRYVAATFCVLLAGYVLFKIPKIGEAVSAAADELGFAQSRDARMLYAWAGVGPGDQALMWGWEPELLAYAGVKSADRATHSEYLIRPNHGRDYLRERLLRDLADKNPALVLDTMRDGYYFQKDRYVSRVESTLRSFPALFERVTASSVEITRRPECAAVYLRRDKAKLLNKTEVPLQSDVPALVDGSITERCEDWWAPGKPGATATLLPAAPTELDTVWVLASRGGRGGGQGSDQKRLGTRHIRIRFRAPDGRVQEDVVHLVDYPLWTVVRTPRDQAVAEIEIKLLDLVGAGPALNEVKAFRSIDTLDKQQEAAGND
jgi:hypothetical protein